jgi:hypothetical protein
VEDFTQTLLDGSDTIIGVADETDGWRQKVDELKNFLKLTFEPVAREVFKNVTEFVDALKPAAKRVADAFEKDGLQGALDQIAVEWDKIYTEKIEPLFIRFLQFLDETVKPIALEIGESIGSAIASGMWSAFKGGVSSLFGPEAGKSILDGLGGDFQLSSPERRSFADMFPDNRPSSAASRLTPSASSVAPSSGNQFVEYAPGLFARAFATGGIVSSPTLGMVGEAGPEAIVPLDRAGVLGDTFVINVSGALDVEGVARQIEKILRDSKRRTGGVLV